MSDIIKYVAENFSALKPFDYFLIIVFTLLLSFGIYKILKWIYKERISTQHEVIKLKDSIIESTKEYMEKLEKDKEELERTKNGLLEIAEKNESMANDYEAQNNYYRLFVGISVVAIALTQIHSNIKSMLNIYIFYPNRSKDDPSPRELEADLARINDLIAELILDNFIPVAHQLAKGNMRSFLKPQIIDTLMDGTLVNELTAIEIKISNVFKK